MSEYFHITVKPAGALCNLRCEYCYFLPKQSLLNSRSMMDENVLETFIKGYIQSQEADTVFFTWHGGEPTLLGVDYFEKVVELQKKYCPPNRRIANDLQTNGLLLDEKWCSFLKANQFLVGLSIDGDIDGNSYRVDSEGNSSWDKVVCAASLLKIYKVDFNTLTVVNRRNSKKGKALYRFLRDSIGSTHMQFMPLVERKGHEKNDPLSIEEPRVEEYSVLPEDWGNFLLEIFEEWYTFDIGKVYVYLFENFLSIWLGYGAKSCLFAENCPPAVAMDRDGSVYACDHFAYPRYRYGNIMEKSLGEIIHSPVRLEFERLKRQLPQECLDCKWLNACNGECPKKRFVKTEKGEAGLNYLCKGYRKFFEGIDKKMKRLADKHKKISSASY